MTGQDGLRDELVAALEAIDNLADNYELADRLLPVVQRHIDAAREQVTETNLIYGAHSTEAYRIFEEQLRVTEAERDAAVARAEQAEQAVQRVRTMHVLVPPVATLPGFCAACLDEEFPCATIRALDGPAEPQGQP